MRLAYVLTTLGIGGAEKQTLQLAERMSKRGHTILLIVLKHAVAEEWPTRLPVLRLNMQKSPAGVVRGLLFARRFLQTYQADIVHSHTFPANMFARTLRAAGVHAPVVNTIHNVFEGGFNRTLLYRVTDPLVTQITAVSEAAEKRFLGIHASRASRVRVLTNGIDIETFTPDRRRRRRVRKEMAAGAAFVWLAVGRIAEAKDYPNLLRAFAAVFAADRNAQLWIAGEGDCDALAYAFPDLTIATYATSPVRFLGLRHDVADLLDAADGFVLSSAWEGMPLAVGEAMAMEKVVVATDVGGVRELVGDAGFVVPAKDAAALAAGMRRVMAMPDAERQGVEDLGRARIEAEFSIESKVDAWDSIYTEVLVGDKL